MTREEAIQILSTREKYGVPCGYTSGYQEALDMAIEALQDKEDEPQFYTEDDYWNGMFAESAEAYKAWTGEEIGSRSEQYKKGFEDAKRAFEIEYAIEAESMLKKNAGLNVLVNAQRELLADRPTGEWIKSPAKSDMWHCSICGSPLMTDDINETHYCPHCGASMGAGMRGGAMMTLEELKTEANAHGYNLIPQKKQEKFIPCTCGCNRREHWIRWVDGGTETTLKCCKCGKEASGMSEAEAKRNWNEMIRGERKESEVEE